MAYIIFIYGKRLSVECVSFLWNEKHFVAGGPYFKRSRFPIVWHTHIYIFILSHNIYKCIYSLRATMKILWQASVRCWAFASKSPHTNRWMMIKAGLYFMEALEMPIKICESSDEFSYVCVRERGRESERTNEWRKWHSLTGIHHQSRQRVHGWNTQRNICRSVCFCSSRSRWFEWRLEITLWHRNVIYVYVL